MKLNFEIEEDKYSGETDLSLQVGKDYWLNSHLNDFLSEGSWFSDLELVLIGMFANEDLTYNEIYEKLAKVKNEVKDRKSVEFSVEV